MKQFSYLTTALVLILGLSITSCMNTEPNPNPDVWGLVRAESSYGTLSFVSEEGDITLIPPATAISTWQDAVDKSSPRWFLWVTVPRTEIEEQEQLSKKTYNITNIVGYADLHVEANTRLTTKAIATDSLANQYSSSIVKIDTLFINGYDDYMRMNVNYPTSCPLEQMHSLTLFCCTDEPIRHGASSAEPDTVNVYLGHNSRNDNYPGSTSLQAASSVLYIHYYCKAFNIRPIVQHAQMNSQSSSLILKIHTKESPTSGTNGTENTYTVRYNR